MGGAWHPLSVPKIISSHSNDAGPTEWAKRPCPRVVGPLDQGKNPCPTISACASHCTTRQHNAHRTEEREVLYRWHPWFGRRVFVHEVSFKGGVRIFRCAETAQGVARCVEVPEWMFDRATCCGMAYAESPRVGCAALDRLKVLILE